MLMGTSQVRAKWLPCCAEEGAVQLEGRCITCFCC
jgi:hypothetical protein